MLCDQGHFSQDLVIHFGSLQTLGGSDVNSATLLFYIVPQNGVMSDTVSSLITDTTNVFQVNGVPVYINTDASAPVTSSLSLCNHIVSSNVCISSCFV